MFFSPPIFSNNPTKDIWQQIRVYSYCGSPADLKGSLGNTLQILAACVKLLMVTLLILWTSFFIFLTMVWDWILSMCGTVNHQIAFWWKYITFYPPKEEKILQVMFGTTSEFLKTSSSENYLHNALRHLVIRKCGTFIMRSWSL